MVSHNVLEPSDAIHIVDSIMGSGKTTAAINYMNAHPGWKFIYVTPYLNEVQRVKDSCASIGFFEPDDGGGVHSKSTSLSWLIKNGKNIVTTHALFFMQPESIADLYERHQYHLIVDEAPDGLCSEIENLTQDEIAFLFDSGFIDLDDDGVVIWKTREKTHFEDIHSLCDNGRARGYTKETETDIAYGLFEVFPPDVFSAFEEVIVLTYLFEGQLFKAYLEMEHISFDNWYLKQDNFTTEQQPDDVVDFRSMIHIFENDGSRVPINMIGDGKFSLSHSWYERNKPLIPQLRRNMHSFFRYKSKAKAEEQMWTTFVPYTTIMSDGSRYKNSFVPCNTRATNDYRKKTKLAYMVNRFVSTFYTIHFNRMGIVFDNDLFALSEMLQWIWRSAIRDGKEIEIYIPSERMRKLLKDWMERVAGDETGDADKK